MKSSKPKILILATTFPRWKDDKLPMFIYDLAKSLSVKNEVHVLSPHAQGAKLYEVMENIKVHRFPYAFPASFERLAYGGGGLTNIRNNKIVMAILPFFFAMNFLYLFYLQIRFRFDVVNAHWFLPSGFVATIGKFIFRYKLISTSHGGDIYGFKRDKLLSRLSLWAIKFVIRSSDGITAVSSSIKNEIWEQIYVHDQKVLDKITVIPMGIYLDELSSIVKTKNNSETLNLLFIGRIVEKKGIPYLLEAIKVLKESNFNNNKFHLKLLGDGPDRKDCEKLAKKLDVTDKVSFMGFIPNSQIKEHLSNADIMIVPSIIAQKGDREGLPVTVMEAMASQTPVIVSNTDGIEDLVQDGYNGLISEMKNPESIALKIIQLAGDENLKQRLIKNALSTIKKFDWKVISRKFLEAYDLDRKKIIMVSSAPPDGGITDYTISLLKQLDTTNRYKIKLIAFKSLYPSFLKKKVQNDIQIEFKSIEIERRLSWWNIFAPLIILFSNNDTKIFHLQYWSPATTHIYYFFGIWVKLFRKKIILTVHNAKQHESNWLFPKNANIIQRVLNKILFVIVTSEEKFLYKIADEIILHTAETKKYFMLSHNQSSCMVIQHPPITVYDKNNYSKTSARKTLGIPDSKIVITIFGNIRKYKGFEDLVSLYNQLDSNYHFLIAGRVWEEMKTEVYEFIKLADSDRITVMDEFIPKELIEAVFVASDLILLSHKDFHSASGILSLASFYNKHILASESFKGNVIVDYIYKDINDINTKLISEILAKEPVSLKRTNEIIEEINLGYKNLYGKL